MSTNAPVVFVHGLWLHSDSWGPWINLFGKAGYEAIAPRWPGDGETVEATRANADAVAGHGVQAVVDSYAEVIKGLPAKPIVIGHSFGGLIAQRLLTEDLAVAAVAIDPAPIKGVVFLPPSALRVASIALRNPANRKRAVSLSRKQFRYGFGNALSQDESDALFEQYAIPSPGRPLFEAASANLARHSPAKVNTGGADRGPLLLTAGGQDHTVPAAISKATRKLYRKYTGTVTYREFPDRGHSLTIDRGWEEIADAALGWLS